MDEEQRGRDAPPACQLLLPLLTIVCCGCCCVCWPLLFLPPYRAVRRMPRPWPRLVSSHSRRLKPLWRDWIRSGGRPNSYKQQHLHQQQEQQSHQQQQRLYQLRDLQNNEIEVALNAVCPNQLHNSPPPRRTHLPVTRFCPPSGCVRVGCWRVCCEAG